MRGRRGRVAERLVNGEVTMGGSGAVARRGVFGRELSRSVD